MIAAATENPSGSLLETTVIVLVGKGEPWVQLNLSAPPPVTLSVGVGSDTTNETGTDSWVREVAPTTFSLTVA